jgi:ATP-dependent helicase HrpB
VSLAATEVGLPIVSVLPELATALATCPRAIVEAPTGAGKSTLVPLYLLDENWARGKRLLMLEPRRVAARAVAARMASIRREALGATVGFRTRLEKVVGAETRLEVITEGILTRMLQDDSSLAGVAGVIFDEFHERSLQADLGLAFCLDAQEHLRPDLRLVVMSATLDGDRLAALLRDAARVQSAGRLHDVDTHWVPAPADLRTPHDQLGRRVADVIVDALGQHPGDVLAFLPGAGDIRRATGDLAARLPPNVQVLPLHGELDAAAQDAALRPAAPGRRKVVLATNLAETSLTIEGVRVVVDGGFERRPRFDPNTGMTRLDTVRISRASAEQRRARAGRTAPGVCYRLWSPSLDATLAAQTPPELLEADLAPLALELALWGYDDPGALRWLDVPPAAAFAQARELLLRLEALDRHGRITAAGRRMATLGVHPRLAHMIARSAELGQTALAVQIAALLGERDILRGGTTREPDLRHRIDALAGRGDAAIDAAGLKRVRRVAGQIARRAGPSAVKPGGELSTDEATGLLLAFAYPDRIGQLRAGKPGHYRLSGGRGAHFAESAALGRSELIVAATLDAGTTDARIDLAAPLGRELVERYLTDAIETRDVVAWDSRTGAVLAQRERRVGALRLDTAALAAPDPEALQREMLRGLRELGLEALPWTPELQQWRARVALLRGIEPDASPPWPDLSAATLLATLESWLAPWLGGVSRRDHLARVDLRNALASLLDRTQRSRLDSLAPTHLTVPSGSRLAIDYANGAPSLSVRLQEVFGLGTSPSLVNGRVPLTLHLLSPARRPVQVTRDLASFWRNGYPEVRRELKGRYPKHYWPEDPLQATPTRRVRPG